MNRSPQQPVIYWFRIILRDVSALVWRRGDDHPRGYGLSQGLSDLFGQGDRPWRDPVATGRQSPASERQRRATLRTVAQRGEERIRRNPTGQDARHEQGHEVVRRAPGRIRRQMGGDLRRPSDRLL